MDKAGVTTFVERRLLNASSLQSKLRTLGIHVADVAMVDVLGMCLYASPWRYRYSYVSISFSVGGTICIFGVGFEVAYLNVEASSKAWIVR